MDLNHARLPIPPLLRTFDILRDEGDVVNYLSIIVMSSDGYKPFIYHKITNIIQLITINDIFEKNLEKYEFFY